MPMMSPWPTSTGPEIFCWFTSTPLRLPQVLDDQPRVGVAQARVVARDEASAEEELAVDGAPDEEVLGGDLDTPGRGGGSDTASPHELACS